MSEEPLVPGKQYVIKHGTKQLFGRVSAIRHRVDINTLEHVPAATFALNEIGRCEFTLSEPVAFDAYADNRETGAFIVIDRINNRTIGAGMICPPSGSAGKGPLGRTAAWPVPRAALAGDGARTRAASRAAAGNGAGDGAVEDRQDRDRKRVERRLFDMGRLATVLDGQDFRLGMSRDLGFTASDRSENMRRAAEAAKLINDAGRDLSGRLRRAARTGAQPRARRRSAANVSSRSI